MAVVTGEFVCPECAARLRIHERGTSEHDLECPECQAPLTVQVNELGQLVVNKRNPVDDDPFAAHAPQRSVMSLVVPVVLLAGVAVFLFTRNSDDDSAPLPEVAPLQQNAEDDQSEVPEPESTSTEPVEPEVVETPDTFEARLKALGQRISDLVATQGAFPQPTWRADVAPEEGLSWLAGLDPALNEGKFQPQWNQPWNSSANDRFVRRSREDLLNPKVDQLAGADRYPASHIVGIAGLGPDGPTLPADDPRAGIFGFGRSTRVEDVKDGLSNTWMANGVVDRLSSWANASESIRAVTREPVINGPDGFGSGNPDRMPILMADGSVRTMNSKTNPVIFRRMAAMADGLSLDPAELGEPGPAEPIGPPAMTSEIPQPEPTATPALPEPVMTTTREPKPPTEEVLRRLNQKIASFELNTPTQLQQVLIELEALAGLPIEFDSETIPPNDPRRLERVTLAGKRRSVSQLLEDLLTPLGLESISTADRIIVRPRSSADDASESD
ncbi:DUF1559 domain-containing protein [Rubinisphaera margarita]|uniref:DUF1559 domain-containing protein n=1 Tax=Rubinisphaera margarita TaxID=2909586 RepID=UPI001EE8A751|nr:DUF1559 domain-containing protein [Rubinisphaera margarita]MCG6157473.1 DUF1559 domain-containing protein [Rubinisphaera margarita]